MHETTAHTDLVTGGAGFIGSHLVERLLARGRRVLVLDDLSTGSRANLAGLAAGAGRPALELVEGSVTDEGLVGRLVERSARVFHLAATVGMRLVVERPAHTLAVNLRGAQTVIEAAARAGRPLLLASSSEVYGKGVRIPFHEDDELLLGATSRRRWSYAVSKAQAEHQALAWRRERGLPVVVARFFNTVGPRQSASHGMVLPTFVRQALAGEPLTVHGTGRQTRCFVDVRDTVEAVLRLADEPRAVGRVVNVGAETEVSIRALAERVVAVTGSSSAIVHLPHAQVFGADFDDVQRRVPDLDRLERLTGLRPAIDLDRTIADVAGASAPACAPAV